MIVRIKLLLILLILACGWSCSLGESGAETTTFSQRLEDDRVIFESNGDLELLAGTIEPVAERTDAPRVIRLDTAPEGLELMGRRVLDARTVGETVLTIGADGVLRHHTPSGTRKLDDDAHAPFSVAGGRVAYVTGFPPDLSLTILDLETGETSHPVPDLQPAWSPALSEDGDEVIFAATDRGHPHLFRLDAAGDLHRLPSSDRVPSSPVAPLWRGDDLLFLDEMGQVRVSVETGTILETKETR